jgi:hypothetical protein
MEQKLASSGPFRESTVKHGIYSSLAATLVL